MEPTQPVQIVYPTQPSTPPLGIKIMSGILLFVGLALGMDVLSSISAILFGGWLVVMGIVALALCIFTERAAIRMFKMQISKTNYYTIIALDTLYLSAKSSLGIFILAGKMPPIQIFLDGLIMGGIVFIILALPFFIMTRGDINNPTPEAKKWGTVCSAMVVVLIIGGIIYSGIDSQQSEEKVINAVANELVKNLAKSPDSNTPKATENSETEKITRGGTPSISNVEPSADTSTQCDKLLNPEFVGKTCGISTPIHSNPPLNGTNAVFCNVTVKDVASTNLLYPGQRSIVDLARMNLTDYEKLQNKIFEDVKLGKSSDLIISKENNGEILTYIINDAGKNYNIFNFKSTQKDFAISLSSSDCSLDALKTIGLNTIEILESQ